MNEGRKVVRKGEGMLPLTYAGTGQKLAVARVSGSPEVKKHLEDLGFVAGCELEVVQSQNGNLIIGVKGSRLAITREMSQKIMVMPAGAA